MKLSLNGLKAGNSFSEKGYRLPGYNVAEVRTKTSGNPLWLHFGAGNIFRMFPALMQQKLLNEGLSDRGIIVCESFDEELIPQVFEAYDNLTVAVTLKADGKVEKDIVASITESLTSTKSRKRLEEIFVSDSLEMVSFTITEKGYSVKDSNGNLLPHVKKDIDAGPENASAILGLLTALCYKRYKASKKPLALVSMDNCSHNGDKLFAAVSEIAGEWVKAGKVEKGFQEYVSDPRSLSFPLSMIDKITPRPSEEVKANLENDGLEDVKIVVTSKNTYASCFVNAEETGYLVIEDIFPNKRPRLEKAGVIFTNRETVDKIEKMKVCTCLNPLHTVLAVYGCLLGYTSISGEMKDKELVSLIKKIGYDEGLPVVINPGIINPKTFIDEVINLRFPNPFVPDTPQRIACDTSQKIPIRFGETLKAYVSAGQDISKLKYIPLFFAGWLRYLMAVDDSGNPFTPSPDPLLEQLMPLVKNIKLDGGDYSKEISKILENTSIFGVDLYKHGIGAKVEGYFKELIAGKGAVRCTLERYL